MLLAVACAAWPSVCTVGDIAASARGETFSIQPPRLNSNGKRDIDTAR